MRTAHGNRYGFFKGQAAVELAFVLPVFFLLIFGIIEGGRLIFTYNELTNAAREGARYAVAHGTQASSPAEASDVQAYVLEKSVGLESPALTVSTSWLDGNKDPGSRVRVSANYSYEPVIGMIFGFSPFSLSASSEMRIHY